MITTNRDPFAKAYLFKGVIKEFRVIVETSNGEVGITPWHTIDQLEEIKQEVIEAQYKVIELQTK